MMISDPLQWQYFSFRRATISSPLDWLLNNLVSVRDTAGRTDYEHLRLSCASAQVSVDIVVLCDELRERSLPRGDTALGWIGNIIDHIVGNYEDAKWWLEDDGFHVEIVPPEPMERVSHGTLKKLFPQWMKSCSVDEVEDHRSKADNFKLSPFDQVAGPLIGKYCETARTGNRFLSASSLGEIAKKLDQAKVKLLDSLQKSPRSKIAAFNKRNQMKAIRTFEELSKSKTFSTLLRRRLYLAKERYRKREGELRVIPCSD